MRALLVAVLLLSAGCISFLKGDDDGGPPSSAAEPDTALFLHVARSFGFNRTAGDASGPFLTIGAHCGQATWTTQPPAVTVNEWRDESESSTKSSGDDWGPSGILVVSIDFANVTNRSYISIGTGPTVQGFDADNDSFDLLTAFGPSRMLVPVTTQDGNVTVSGTVLQPGVPHVERIAYLFTETHGDPPASYTVYETLWFTLHGNATVTTLVTGSLCA